MLVYMLVNEVTDMVYVGQTLQGLFERMKEHENSAKVGSRTRLSNAIREYGFEMFTPVVLQNCYDTDTLNRAEECWIEYTCCREPAIGYNTAKGAVGIVIDKNEKIEELTDKFSKAKLKKQKTTVSPLLTEEEREKYRAWGRKGAAISKERMLKRVIDESKVKTIDNDITKSIGKIPEEISTMTRVV